MTGQSHFMLIFWLRKVTLRGHINSVKWPLTRRWVCPPPNQRRGGHTLLRLRGGGAQFRRLEKKPSTELCAVYKRNIKSAKWMPLYSVQCTQKPLWVTLRNRINSVPWTYAVTSTPQSHFTRSLKLRTMNVRNWSKIPLAKLRTFIVRSWCDRVHSWYRVDVTA